MRPFLAVWNRCSINGCNGFQTGNCIRSMNHQKNLLDGKRNFRHFACGIIPLKTTGWFQLFFFTPTWGNDAFWLIFFRLGWNHQPENSCQVQVLWFREWIHKSHPFARGATINPLRIGQRRAHLTIWHPARSRIDFLYEKTVHDYYLQHPGVPQVLSILCFNRVAKGGFLIWKTEGGKLARQEFVRRCAWYVSVIHGP